MIRPVYRVQGFPADTCRKAFVSIAPNWATGIIGDDGYPEGSSVSVSLFMPIQTAKEVLAQLTAAIAKAEGKTSEDAESQDGGK